MASTTDNGDGYDLTYFYALAIVLIVTALIGVIVGIITTVQQTPQQSEPQVPPTRLQEQQPGRREPNDEGPISPAGEPEGVDLEEIITGLDQPVYLTHAGDGSGRLFIVEQDGRVLVMEDPGAEPQPYLDLRAKVRARGEQGLLSIAFHPSFAGNGYIFASYTNTNGDTVIERYTANPAGNGRPDPDSAVVIITVEQPFANHNGGLIKFGPDGYLYMGLGDGGSGGDPQGHGQNPDTLLGALLRLDVDAVQSGGSLAPPDNPFVNGPGRDELWAIGLRNPWRFSFDRVTGDLYIGDVGQSAREEINFQPAGSPGGQNYGWNIYEGTKRFSNGDAVSDVVWPVAEYETGRDGCAVTGGYVYRGDLLPQLQGVYLYGDYCSGTIWGLIYDGEQWRNGLIMETDLRISSFGEDEAGELYVIDHNGAVYRLVPGSKSIPAELLLNK